MLESCWNAGMLECWDAGMLDAGRRRSPISATAVRELQEH
jgi:hypothetical protein